MEHPLCSKQEDTTRFDTGHSSLTHDPCLRQGEGEEGAYLGTSIESAGLHIAVGVRRWHL